MRILLTGGGTGGPVMPLLAVAQEIRKLQPHTEFLFVGTRRGPERQMVQDLKIDFAAVSAARWRRFFSLKNFFAPLVFALGLIESLFIVAKFRPDVVFTAGGFVGVPVAWAGKLFGAKVIVHQQDARVGLANKLATPLATHITTAFAQTAKEFRSGSGLGKAPLKPRAEWIGNPVRADLFQSAVDPYEFFSLSHDLPILLVFGGATGALQINELMIEILPELVTKYQVVHLTGKGKHLSNFQNPNYHPFELLGYAQYAAILKVAHLVIARAGLSTIAELSAMGKTAIIIPIPHSHQEDNAKVLVYTDSAAVLLREHATPEELLALIQKLTFDPRLAQELSDNMRKLIPKNAAEKLAIIILAHE